MLLSLIYNELYRWGFEWIHSTSHGELFPVKIFLLHDVIFAVVVFKTG